MAGDETTTDAELRTFIAETRAAVDGRRTEPDAVDAARVPPEVRAELPRMADYLQFWTLKRARKAFGKIAKPPWKHANLERAEAAPKLEKFMPAPLTGMSKLFGKAKHEQEVADGQARYKDAVREHSSREAQQTNALAKARAEWHAAAAQLEEQAKKQHEQIDTFKADYRRGDLDAVVSYCTWCSKHRSTRKGSRRNSSSPMCPSPGNWSSSTNCPRSRRPRSEGVPVCQGIRYHDRGGPTAAQVKTLYSSVVAQMAIRTVQELFQADYGGHIDTVVFNGVVDTTDPEAAAASGPAWSQSAPPVMSSTSWTWPMLNRWPA